MELNTIKNQNIQRMAERDSERLFQGHKERDAKRGGKTEQRILEESEGDEVLLLIADEKRKIYGSAKENTGRKLKYNVKTGTWL